MSGIAWLCYAVCCGDEREGGSSQFAEFMRNLHGSALKSDIPFELRTDSARGIRALGART